MASLLLLPDEIKIKIFEYLSGADKLQLLKVCKDFDRVGVDRDVIQRLNFSKCYKLTLPLLRSITRQATASKVTYLDLNGIHWIPSYALRNTLVKFKNLTALFILDTQLNFRDLATVLKVTTKVKKLAISMKAEHCSDIIERPIILPITHLYVTYNSYAIRVLLTLFIKIKTLEELWLIESKIPLKEFTGDDLPWICSLGRSNTKVLNRIVFSRQYGISQYGKNFLDSLRDNTWKETKNYTHDKTVFQVHEAPHFITEKNQLEYWNNLSFFLRVPSKELQDQISAQTNNKDIEELKTKFIFTENARNIWKIKCNSSVFWRQPEDNKNEEKEPVALFKKRRVGIDSSKLTDNLKFKEFCTIATNMQDFEIEDLDSTAVQKKLWHINDLTFMQNWKMLRKFTITSINMYNGKFLIDVVVNCPLLECLKIQDELIQDNISVDLCNALKYAKNLKDLRYQRKGSIPIDLLFESVINCPKLERLYVQCMSAVKISKKPLETVITKCENIIFLFILISELPETFCKSIKQSLNEFGIKPQQIINIRGQAYGMKNIAYEDIPQYHVEEMVCQDSEPYWNYLKTFFY